MKRRRPMVAAAARLGEGTSAPLGALYETHVHGFTRHPRSGVGEQTRGTYAGLPHQAYRSRCDPLGPVAHSVVVLFAMGQRHAHG